MSGLRGNYLTMSSDSLRTLLEARQIPIYFAAVLIAFVTGFFVPAMRVVGIAIEPMLALMLFVTFLQVPMGELRKAMTNLRFVGALVTANFFAIPLLVALVLPWIPGEPLIRIGFLLVVLTPCIDYVVTFAHLGRADSRSLLASTPILLVGQMLLLPVYLRLFLSDDAHQLVSWEPFVQAFVWLIAIPLLLAAGCQAWAARSERGTKVTGALGLLPVPATAGVLAVVVAAVTPELGQAWVPVRQIAPWYAAFALIAPVVGWTVASAWRLQPAQRVAIAFSAATRNSLVVLPLALAIPGGIPILPAVIVTQTLIELVAELVYVNLATRARSWTRPRKPGLSR